MGKLDIVFLGTSAFGLPALRALRDRGHSIQLVVTQPDRPRGRGRRPSPSPIKEEAEALRIPVIQPERVGEIVPQLERVSPDALVVAAYGQILPSAVLRLPKLAPLNIHASILPRFRGAAPIQWAIVRGEEETGVTIFRIVRKMDAGPILAARAVPIEESETAGELEERLAHLGAELLLEVLTDLPAALRDESPQEDASVTYAPRLGKEDGHLSFGDSPRSIRDRIRGLNPRPGTHADLIRRGSPPERVRILEAVEAPAAPGSSPGEVVSATDEGITVAAKDGAIRITRIQSQGSRPMPAADYLRGRPVSPGDRFE